MLANPARTEPVSVIAGRVGFVSAAHVSRLYLAEYGTSPRRATAAGP
ncbi:MAG TPA: hypothetical protein VHZ33_38910 [Trebonia sp.]|jgi:transcriptional regulator GlxA family with amidase domain|nr:hypothetical protein [Trebonia sp.]